MENVYAPLATHGHLNNDHSQFFLGNPPKPGLTGIPQHLEDCCSCYRVCRKVQVKRLPQLTSTPTTSGSQQHPSSMAYQQPQDHSNTSHRWNPAPPPSVLLATVQLRSSTYRRSPVCLLLGLLPAQGFMIPQNIDLNRVAKFPVHALKRWIWLLGVCKGQGNSDH